MSQRPALLLLPRCKRGLLIAVQDRVDLCAGRNMHSLDCVVHGLSDACFWRLSRLAGLAHKFSENLLDLLAVLGEHDLHRCLLVFGKREKQGNPLQLKIHIETVVHRHRLPAVPRSRSGWRLRSGGPGQSDQQSQRGKNSLPQYFSRRPDISPLRQRGAPRLFRSNLMVWLLLQATSKTAIQLNPSAE